MPSFVRPVLASLLLTFSAALHAQQTPDVAIYRPAFFAEAAPATAYDMLERLPGFSIVDADPDVRGYAGAQGNVLIDGVRPGSKRESLEQILGRIPAHAVERIEVIRRSAPGIDLLGHAMLANIVRREAAVTSYLAQVGALLDANGGAAPQFEMQMNRQWNEREFEAAIGSTPELDDDSGRGRIVAIGSDDELRADSAIDTRQTVQASYATANWRQPVGAASLDAYAALRDTRDEAAIAIDTLRPEPGRERVAEDERLREAEIGARVARQLTDRTRIELLASQQLGWLDAVSDAVEDDETEHFKQRTRSGEGILRLDLRQARTPALTLNAGIELARNTLDGDALLLEDGAAVDLPGSRVHIAENRAEATFGGEWEMAADWRFESALRVESSRLAQSGDQTQRRDFVYYKPSVALRWERNARERWRLSVGREVGQLDFEDFVASASLDTGVVSAGNAQLEPDKTWRTALSWERDFLRDGAIVVTAAHDRIADAIDRVPIVLDDEVFDAPGNIGDATRDSLELSLGTSLDAIGLQNVRIDVAALWQHSRVRDPTTGAMRGLSEEAPFEGEIGFAHTIASHAIVWGIDHEFAARETEYRFDEIAVERAGSAWEIFIERSFARGWRLRAELDDVSGLEVEQRRERYDGLRSQQPLDEIETRRHRVPAQLMLTLRREMGG
jgi:hypothetical protein